MPVLSNRPTTYLCICNTVYNRYWKLSLELLPYSLWALACLTLACGWLTGCAGNTLSGCNRLHFFSNEYQFSHGRSKHGSPSWHNWCPCGRGHTWPIPLCLFFWRSPRCDRTLPGPSKAPFPPALTRSTSSCILYLHQAFWLLQRPPPLTHSFSKDNICISTSGTSLFFTVQWPKVAATFTHF